MSELDDSEREFLQRYLAETTPGASAKARAWESLSARLAVAPSAPPNEPATTVSLRLLKGLGLATLLVGPLVGVGALAGSERATAEVVPAELVVDASPAHEQVIVARTEPALANDEPVRTSIDPSPPVTRHVPDSSRQEHRPRSTRPARKTPASTPRPKSPAPPKAADASTLQAELALIRRGQTALRDGEPARALRAFDQHAQEFPKGILAEERMVKRMVALCELGHKDRARAAAKKFLATHGTSPLASHARDVCDEEEIP